jgi:signal transduction histidine kinase/CheY-like chemotaxis protein
MSAIANVWAALPRWTPEGQPEPPQLAQLARNLFRNQRMCGWIRTDRLFAGLMIVQWLAGIGVALWVTPHTWIGSVSSIHIHVLAAIFLGGAIAAFPVLLVLTHPGHALTRHVIAGSEMLASALLIDLTGGRIETHFHIFGSLAFLAFYRDWRVLLTATLVTATDHLLGGVYWPRVMFGTITPGHLRWLEHVGWVLFEDVFLCIMCHQSILEMRGLAHRQAALELTNDRVAGAVEERTGELARSNGDLQVAMEKLYERQRQLQLLYAVADAANRATSVEAAIQVALDEICAYTKWPIGHAYLVSDKPIYCLAPTTLWHLDNAEEFLAFREATESQSFRSGESLPGRVLEHARTVWDADVTLDNDFDRAKTAGEVGVRGGIAIPVFAGKKVIAVLEFFSRDIANPDETWLETASQVGTQIGRTFERKARDEADRANRAKSEFLSRMSHELRTPLNAILGFAQLLEMEKPTDTQLGWVGHILIAGRHLLVLINEVLEISRIEAGELQLSLEPVCVGDAVMEAVDLVRPLAAQRGIEICVPDWSSDSRHVLADSQNLRQVLLNLLANAVKYNRVDGRVTISCPDGPAENIRMMISDTGYGIAEENLARLFVPFDRLGAENSGVQGTGLGLALAKLLVESMGGTIAVVSKLEKGTCFSVQLPRSQSTNRCLTETGAPDPTARISPPSGCAECNILYIEDNLSNVALIEELLSKEPAITLVTATEGHRGLDLARETLPDLILLDLHLPGLPGWEVLEELKASPETLNIPVIVLSADATRQQIDRLMEAGAYCYLTKPLSVPELLSAVQKACSLRAQSSRVLL